MFVGRRSLGLWGGGTAATAICAATIYYYCLQPSAPPQIVAKPAGPPRYQSFGDYTLWWDNIPPGITSQASTTGTSSNLRPQDYAGPDACKHCHKKQYAGWENHPHRWMNSLVENTVIHGDFDNHTLSYLGGEVTFFKEADTYRMRLQRGDVRREYAISQTIGSRFYQYYVGRQLQGPEPADHPLYHDDHVLPLGYWMSRKEWVPVVHVHGEVTEEQRHDPYAPRNDWPVTEFTEYADRAMDLYRSQCNFCHTTFSAGDMFIRHQQLFARHIPARVDLSLPKYLQAARPDFWPDNRTPAEMSENDFASILKQFRAMDATQHAITLGISCEACHLGNQEHVQDKLKKPKFFPHAAEAVIRADTTDYDLGRTHDNINWVCGRCHAGHRPQLAAGMATWNSTEYTDAMRGSCYSQLTCTKCHDPHQSMGQAWSRTAAEDDALCLSCHQQFAADSSRTAHTHHGVDSEGSRCMNCHMPRMNEGLQEVVRTHMIFSPTNPAMLESNQPNACNQCHVDKSIDWTLDHLQKRYRRSYSELAIQTNYPHRDRPAALGWLESKNEAVRLVAADSLARAKADWAIPDLIQALDDPFVLNRQFARIGLESLLDRKLTEFGYQFYHTPAERKPVIERLREALSPDKQDTAAIQSLDVKPDIRNPLD